MYAQACKFEKEENISIEDKIAEVSTSVISGQLVLFTKEEN